MVPVKLEENKIYKTTLHAALIIRENKLQPFSQNCQSVIIRDSVAIIRGSVKLEESYFMLFSFHDAKFIQYSVVRRFG